MRKGRQSMHFRRKKIQMKSFLKREEKHGWNVKKTERKELKTN
jgi:hypothetical protein